MHAADLVFKAVAHPARRGILALLAVGERSVKDLTAEFAISQPAVSQHLRELKEAGLVSSERVGLEQHYRLTPRPLRHIVEWSDQYRRLIDPQGHAWLLAPAPPSGQRNPHRKGEKDGR